MILPKRMIKSLVTLATCMTCGALLLAAIEPQPRDNAHAPVLLQGRFGNSEPTTRTLWKSISIQGVDTQGNAKKDGDSEPIGNCHMRIDTTGRLHRTSLWENQKSLEGFPQSILIHIEISGANQPQVYLSQLQTLDSILQQVFADYELSSDQVRYQSRDPRIHDLGLYLTQVRERLASIQFPND